MNEEDIFSRIFKWQYETLVCYGPVTQITSHAFKKVLGIIASGQDITSKITF